MLSARRGSFNYAGTYTLALEVDSSEAQTQQNALGPRASLQAVRVAGALTHRLRLYIGAPCAWMTIQVVCWNVADLYFEKYKGYNDAKRDFIAQHSHEDCSAICLQEAWDPSLWSEYSHGCESGLRLGPGLRHAAVLIGNTTVSISTGRTRLQGRVCVVTSEILFYTIHTFKRSSLACCGSASRVRERQMLELQHAFNARHSPC